MSKNDTLGYVLVLIGAYNILTSGEDLLKNYQHTRQYNRPALENKVDALRIEVGGIAALLGASILREKK